MVSEEIVEGLRFSMNKGDSLMKAMMSFYNAGYSKAEVEEAAKMLSQPSLQNLNSPVQVQTPQTQTPPGTPTQYVSQYGSQISSTSQTPATQAPVAQMPPQNFQTQFVQAPIPENPQMVSSYGVKSKHPLSTGVMIFLAIILFLLLSALVSLIIFKDVIAGFFGGFL